MFDAMEFSFFLSLFHPFPLAKLSIETLPNRINQQKLHFLIFIVFLFFFLLLIFISGKWNFSIAPYNNETATKTELGRTKN